MCLIRCDVRFRTTRLGGSGVRGRAGHYTSNRQQVPAGDRLRGEADLARRSPGGVEECRVVYRARDDGAEGVWSPHTDNCITETDHRPAHAAVSTSRVRPLDVRPTTGNIEAAAGGSKEGSQDGRNGQRPTTGTGRHDTRRQTVGGGSRSFEDAVSQCALLSGPGSSNSSPATRRQRIVVSRLPGLFRIGSRSVEGLDSLTPHGHTTQTRQLSQRAVEDALRIQSLEGNSLRPDFATRQGWQRDWAGRPASFYTTPGISIWGPRPSSNRQTENAGD